MLMAGWSRVHIVNAQRVNVGLAGELHGGAPGSRLLPAGVGRPRRRGPVQGFRLGAACTPVHGGQEGASPSPGSASILVRRFLLSTGEPTAGVSLLFGYAAEMSFQRRPALFPVPSQQDGWGRARLCGDRLWGGLGVFAWGPWARYPEECQALL